MTDRDLDGRPDPDQLLASIQKEESKQKRGKLKIFFGAAAGVGKTYTMLESALARKREGVDVVIGYLQAHGRKETEDKAAGLESIPTRKFDYRGATLEEVDVEAVIARQPALVLVDELAHTNAPGSTHPKRYMDVLDLLTAEIDVYTTVNVQHLESRADAVEQITGVTIHETVPDMLIDMADEIELIDLEPDELIRRLKEGKVYNEQAANVAIDKFFRKGNLTALREMALRLTAERVDVQLQDYKSEKHITTPWKSAERLMVAISPSPLSERLIRWTRRMAYNLEAPWVAVYVEPLQALNDAAKEQLAKNIAQVHKLDGEMIVTSGADTVAALIRVAQQRNITQMVIGKPLRSRLQELLTGGSLVNRIVRSSGGIDVTVITGDPDETAPRRAIQTLTPTLHSDWKQYAFAAVVISIAIAFFYGLESWEPFRILLGDYRTVALMLLFIVVTLSNFLGRGPILLAAALSALLWDLLFIPPQFTLIISELADILLFVLYLLVALVTGNLTARAKNEGRIAREREERMSALYTMANEIAEASTLDEVVRIGLEQTGEVFNAEVALFLPKDNGRLSSTPHPASSYRTTEKEFSIASYAFERNQPTGKYTDTLAVGAEAFYNPLVTPGGVAGVIGIKLRINRPLTIDQRNLFETFVNHIALAVERELLDVRSQEAAVAEQSEKLYATLLDSISHELRTPLTTIRGSTTALINPATTPLDREVLGQDVQDATERLNRLVQNLLDMSRLQSGHLKLSKQWTDVRDLTETVIRDLEDELSRHDLVVDIPSDLPLVSMDAGLMEHVLFNLLHNAAEYTPAGARIRVTARAEGDQLVLSIADRGKGLPPEFLNQAFDKFARGPDSRAGGAGLGLSIVKGFVEAHEGIITAENRPTRGGARFTLRMPIGGTPPNIAPHRVDEARA